MSTKPELPLTRRPKLFLAVLAVFLFSLFPLYWAFQTAVHWSGSFSLAPFGEALGDPSFLMSLLNSVLVAGTAVGVSLLAGILAAYALARQRFAGRRLLLGTFLAISAFPQIALLSGLFELIRLLGLFNHRTGLACSYLIFTLPFTIWSLFVFMREVPRSLEDAARVDGAGTPTIIFRVFVPLLAPALVATGLLGFIAAWNEFLFALTLTLTNRSRTVPVAIALIGGTSQHEVPWGRIMAASLIVTVPVLALVIGFQKRIVSGLTAGAVKG